MANISVIGSGGWGTANAIFLAKKGNKVKLWSYLEQESLELKLTRENKPFLPGVIIDDNVTFTSDLADCAGADLFVMATPSFAVKRTAKALAPHIKDGDIILNISKGFDEETGKRLSQVIVDEIPNCKVASMSGPSHAEEVALSKPTTNVVASEYEGVAKYVQDLYMDSSFRIYTGSDLIGLELGGSLKNIIALAVGICHGMGLGDNSKAALMTRGLTEITRLGVAMGAKAETFSGLTGLGDLVVTCTSTHSRNRRAGVLIGQGLSAKEAEKEVKMTVEGVKATYAAYKLAKEYNVDMPIVEAMYLVLNGEITAEDSVNLLMCREKKNEL